MFVRNKKGVYIIQIGQEVAIIEDIMEKGNKPNEDLSGLSVCMWLESSIYIKWSQKCG